MAVAAFGMLMTSCQNDLDFVQNTGETSTVSFQVGTPEIATRAYSDGMTATVLQYAVYDSEGNILSDLTKTDATINGSTTVNLQLTTGDSYAVIFWAAAEDAPYTVNFDTKTMTVSYDGAKSNDETRDAFYKYHTFTVTGTQTETIELKRPFAQLNIGTNDYAASTDAGYTPKTSAVTVKNIYSTLDLVEGKVSNEVAAEFALADIKKNETFPVAGNEYLAMNYLLVAADKEVVDVEFTFADEAGDAKTRTVGSVPVQRNHRTNIYGKLLTSDVDINVTINPEYEDDLNKYYSWNGQADTSWYNDTDNEFELVTSEALAGLAKLVDEGNDFDDKTIFLKADLDMSQFNWDPIGDNRTDAAFRGTFDGEGHTIEGLHYTGNDCWNGALYGDKRGFGLFSLVDEAVVKNVNLKKETFGSYTVITGAVAGYAFDTTFENISISETKVAGYNWYTGGVVGWAGGVTTFKGIDLAPTTVVGTLWDSHGQCAGGIAGGISSTAQITIEDCNIACVMDVINDVTSNYKWWIYRVSGMIVGNISTTQTIDGKEYPNPENVTCKNVTVTYGDWMNYHYCQGYWNRGWGRVESSDYVDGIDHTQCNHAAGEEHYVRVIFDQLFGGGPNGNGRSPVYGLREFPGVTVNYPFTYNQAEVTDKASLDAAIKAGQNVKLATDIDFGTTQLVLDNVKIDLNGKTLTTQMAHGGISLKNGASIKNGTIEHTSTVAAIKAFNVGTIEDVTIKCSCTTLNKVVTGIAVQQGGYVGTIKNVHIEGASQCIEVPYQATVDLIENVSVEGSTNGTAVGQGLLINGGKVVKAVNSSFKGDDYGVQMLLKGVFAVGLELVNCNVTGTTASIYAWDEKGISNTSGSLTLTYDATTTLNGSLTWDFEDECLSVVTLNKPN